MFTWKRNIESETLWSSLQDSWSDLTKAGVAVIVLAAIVCGILLQGFIEAQMAIDAARNLRVRFAGFEHGEVRNDRLYVDTLLIFKNRRSYDVEIDGGSCSVSLDWGFGYRLLAPLEKRNRADTSAKNGA